MVAQEIIPQTKCCYIAYLDILGTKTHIEETDSLGKMYEIYQFTLEMLRHRNESVETEIVVKIFSDNILVSIEKSEDYQKSLEQLDDLIHFVALFQLAAFIKGNWLTRGCITEGELYANKDDNIFVWGKGLIRAYRLEEAIAFYPRIIIDSGHNGLVANAVILSSTHATDGFQSVPPIPLQMDTDSYWYISYEEIQNENGEPIFLQQIKNSLEIQLHNFVASAVNDDKINQKLSWAIKYHNSICEKYSLSMFEVDMNQLNENVVESGGAA